MVSSLSCRSILGTISLSAVVGENHIMAFRLFVDNNPSPISFDSLRLMFSDLCRLHHLVPIVHRFTMMGTFTRIQHSDIDITWVPNVFSWSLSKGHGEIFKNYYQLLTCVLKVDSGWPADLLLPQKAFISLQLLAPCWQTNYGEIGCLNNNSLGHCSLPSH